MLTVKLIRGNTTKIVEGETVSIYAAGKPEPEPDTDRPTNGPRPCTNKVRQIVVERGGKQREFYVGDETDIPLYGDIYDYAYIENSNGTTTERVYGQP